MATRCPGAGGMRSEIVVHGCHFPRKVTTKGAEKIVFLVEKMKKIPKLWPISDIYIYFIFFFWGFCLFVLGFQGIFFFGGILKTQNLVVFSRVFKI